MTMSVAQNKQGMTLRELQSVLGDRIRIAQDNGMPLEDRVRETEISQTISSLAKQMVNNADVVLRAEKLLAEGRLRGTNIEAMIGYVEPNDGLGDED